MANVKLPNKFFGVDPGKLTADKQIKIQSMTGWTLFLIINYYEDEIAKIDINNKKNHSVLIQKYLELDYCKAQLIREGVDFTIPEVGKRLSSNGSYQEWFNFYNNYFKTLRPEDRYRLPKYALQGNDLSEWAPNQNWQDALPKNKA